MKNEVRIFFTALMFLTRLPVPKFTDHSSHYLEKSAKYFPLVGWMVGGISALVLLLFHRFISIDLAVLASVIAGILTTGAFHEDGFADTCDGFGGGWTKEKILDIMKDSRLGTFGTLGLVLMLASKFILLKELALAAMPDAPNYFHLLVFSGFIIAAHAFSRFMAIVTIQTSVYVFADNRSKSKPLASTKLSWAEFAMAALFAFIPFLVLPAKCLLVTLPALVTTFLLVRYFKKWIGGYTGDCLGAIQQTTEVVCYLSLLLLWKYI